MTSHDKELTVCSNSQELHSKLRSAIEHSFTRFRESGRKGFRVAVSGASMIGILSDVIPSINSLSANDWKTWLIYYVDERLVPFEDPESTHGSYLKKLIPKTDQLTAEQLVPIDPSLTPAACAADYEAKLRKTVELGNKSHFPLFDLILLGFGPDGHIGSLFPGHSLLHEDQKWVADIRDSPKPPPTRVTFTLPVINAAADILVLGTGSSKQEIVHRVFVNDDKSLPVNMVKTATGRKVQWIIDVDAGKRLTTD